MAPLSSMLLVLMIAVTAMAADWQANPNDCGKTYEGMSSMIVGGHPAKEDAWPWQVAMYKKGYFICGGSLIDPWWVLTAAHCVDPCLLCKPEVYAFKVGSNNLSDFTDVIQVRWASRIIGHPKYDFEDRNNFDNDIALFKMTEPFILSEDFKVNTICLPTKDMDDQFVVGQNATVTGWGTLHSGDKVLSQMLNEAVVPIYSWTKCNQSLAGKHNNTLLTDNMMCAGFEAGDVDACQGDSGGPLVAYPSSNYTDQYFQIGVVNWGYGCGNQNLPGVYTNVTRYEDWIRSFFNTPTQKSYVACACEETQATPSEETPSEETPPEEMPPSTRAAIPVLSVLLTIFICISVVLGIYLCRQNKIEYNTIQYNRVTSI